MMSVSIVEALQLLRLTKDVTHFIVTYNIVAFQEVFSGHHYLILTTS